VRALTAGGPILGAFADASFPEEALTLGDDETLVMFTDGVTEARAQDDEEFGEQRLMSCLREHAGCAPDVLLQRVFEAVRHFSLNTDQRDDMTVTVTRPG
jgi:serine phosphatase RsbU (regulator of sigma subunit)